MDTAGALAAMGVTDADFTEPQRRELDENGYFIVPDLFGPDQVETLRVEYDRWESAAKVFENYNIEPGGVFIIDLYNKSPVFDLSFECKATLAAAHELMGEIKVYSLNGRNPVQGHGQQSLHSDAHKLRPGDWRVVNTMIMLDDLDESNGATRVVPGSHNWPALNVPDYNDGDGIAGRAAELSAEERALIPEDPLQPHPQEVKITGTAGSVCVINGHIWHGGTRNESGAKRRLLHFAVGRRDGAPELVQREHLTPALLARSTPSLRYLLDIEDAEPVAPNVV
jgi:ectoine hydroxylase-related dioxygenase (phytanoyl-CoA dioxygenase family)